MSQYALALSAFANILSPTRGTRFLRRKCQIGAITDWHLVAQFVRKAFEIKLINVSQATQKNVQKNFRKLLTPLCRSEIVWLHTVNKNTNMRTKTLFLAAAFVAAGLASSMAQSNVYSLNIVGYYNIPITSQQTFCANSLNNGTPANRADQVVPYTDGDGLSIWNGVRFTSITMDSGSGTGWADSGGSDVPLASLPVLSPGTGWFYTRAGTVTNLTLVGSVPLGTNTVTLNLAQNAVGSPLPYGGLVSTGPIGCPVADGDGVQTWNGAKFVLSSRDSGAGTGWANSGGSDVPEPSLSVGQGFFYSKVGGTVIWTQILNNP